MEARLIKRYDSLVKSHMNNNSTVSSGIKATLNSNIAFTQTQAAWRFFNNDKCGLQELVQPLIQAGKQQLSHESDEYGLVVHDWSNLGYNKHTGKKDTYNVFKACVGYHLQTSLLISDRHGGPLAPIAMNLKSKTQLLSTYGTPSRDATNLEELIQRIKNIEAQSFEKELIHIVDREGDAVSFFRALKPYKWLIRVKGGNSVKCNGINQIISKVAAELDYTYSREVLYKGSKALQRTSETIVEITRPAKPKKNKKHLPHIPGEAVKCRLIVSKVYDQFNKELAVWYLLSNVEDTVSAATIALWYYWRWSIENFFKLLKTAGLNLEQWQQETAIAIARRILVASMACVYIWQLAHNTRPEAAEVRKLLVRFSGRQMKWGVEFTYNALFAGLWSLLTMNDLLEQYDPQQLKELIHNSINLIGVGVV